MVAALVVPLARVRWVAAEAEVDFLAQPPMVEVEIPQDKAPREAVDIPTGRTPEEAAEAVPEPGEGRLPAVATDLQTR